MRPFGASKYRLRMTDLQAQGLGFIGVERFIGYIVYRVYRFIGI